MLEGDQRRRLPTDPAREIGLGIPMSRARSGVVSLHSTCSLVLIDEDRVSIRVYGDEARRPRGALVRLFLQRHSLGL